MVEHSFSKLVSNHLSLPEEDPIKIMRHCNLVSAHSWLYNLAFNGFMQIMLWFGFHIFAPTIHKDHWYCYVLDKSKKKLFVLNSLFNGRNEEEKELDLAMVNKHI
jgi:hypothetical protein